MDEKTEEWAKIYNYQIDAIKTLSREELEGRCLFLFQKNFLLMSASDENYIENVKKADKDIYHKRGVKVEKYSMSVKAESCTNHNNCPTEANFGCDPDTCQYFPGETQAEKEK